MTTADEIEARRQRDAAIRAVVEMATYRARDLAHIGARLVLLEYVLSKSEDPQLTQRELAEQLGIGESALSERLTAAEESLQSIRDPKFSSGL